ncbi:hypothetical protein [Methanobrevibacter sp. UBA212]|uniref:hypothetical protein n=1 Tax=Methanobrevibacter sp. UBA212 TaxID=1915476 RepID=UPI0025F4E8AE|nr:hypothetical protein [Methanobrevibacter sp. UBA212]
MEIEMNKIESDAYYNEVLAIISSYKNLVENPRQKIKGLNRQAITLTVISVAFLVVFSVLYLQNRSNTLYLIVVAIFAVAFVLGIIYNVLIRRRISKFKNKGSDRKLVIEDDYVELTVGNEKSRLGMSEIQYVLINKYSISFIPNKTNSTLIAIGIRYREDVLNNFSHKELIVDNSSLYQ